MSTGADDTLSFAFASPEALLADFRLTVIVFGILIIVLVVAFHVSYRNSLLAMTLGTRIILGLLGFAASVWYAYAGTYRQFVTAAVDDQELRVQFAGPFSREVIVPAKDIVAIRYGLPDRGRMKCRISIETSSSTIFSAWIPGAVPVCTRIRDELLHALNRQMSP